MAKTKRKSKKEQLSEQIAAAVDAGREVAVEAVDFSDPNRPKTCLEVDFPIIPINQIAIVEGNAGKPIYQMSKWWARRRSSVFRSMLLAAAMKAPDDESKAAKAVWDVYYANHQKHGTLYPSESRRPVHGGWNDSSGRLPLGNADVRLRSQPGRLVRSEKRDGAG